jgi:hypothetical protein
MGDRERALLALLALGIIDVFVPLPVVGLLLAYVILDRPHWFRRLVDNVYADTRREDTNAGNQP